MKSKILIPILIAILLSSILLAGLTQVQQVKTQPNTLPNSVIGDDYLIWGNWNGDPANGWGQATYLNIITQTHTTVVKLGITFNDEPAKSSGDSVYVESKMDATLGYLNTVGAKAIICDNNPSNVEAWFGSQSWINDWVQLATNFKGDQRIASFELLGEPETEFLATNCIGANNNQTIHLLDEACASCIQAIRAVDPTRTIMYPNFVDILTYDSTFFYNDLVACGITSMGNIQYDIVHPYYYEDYPKMDPMSDPVDVAGWYWATVCEPQINYFGASNCFCGETFPWQDTGGVADGGWNGQLVIHASMQQQFEVAMINHFCSVGMGFDLWCFSSDWGQMSNCLSASNYYSYVSGTQQTPAPTTPTPVPTNSGGGG